MKFLYFSVRQDFNSFTVPHRYSLIIPPSHFRLSHHKKLRVIKFLCLSFQATKRVFIQKPLIHPFTYVLNGYTDIHELEPNLHSQLHLSTHWFKDVLRSSRALFLPSSLSHDQCPIFSDWQDYCHYRSRLHCDSHDW